MPFEIDLHSDVPSYQQLATQIRAKIEEGEYGPRDPIPSIAQLRGETGLAAGTIRHAIDVLKSEGWVYTVPGRGTFANNRVRRRPRQPGD